MSRILARGGDVVDHHVVGFAFRFAFAEDDSGGGDDARHHMAVTRRYWQTLPERVRAHLHCPVVEELTPIVQKHTIEGLVMGDA